MDRAIAPTILIVDDYDSVRIALSVILQRNGFNVLSAENPAAAKRIWSEKKNQIDLLLVDISMPTMSGPDLVREFQKDGEMKPVVFVTGNSEAQAREATRDLKDPVILHKPFSQQALLETIQKLSGKSPGSAPKS